MEEFPWWVELQKKVGAQTAPPRLPTPQLVGFHADVFSPTH